MKNVCPLVPGAFRWIAAISALVLVFASIVLARAPRPEVGHQAPDFALSALNGDVVRLSKFQGKVILLNFWATWCPPCRLEMPTMEQVYQEYRRRGFQIVAVSIDVGSKEEVGEFMKELGLSFPALHDPRMRVSDLYRVISLPTSFLIDRQGRIRFKEIGYRDWTEDAARKRLEELLR